MRCTPVERRHCRSNEVDHHVVRPGVVAIREQLVLLGCRRAAARHRTSMSRKVGREIEGLGGHRAERRCRRYAYTCIMLFDHRVDGDVRLLQRSSHGRRTQAGPQPISLSVPARRCAPTVTIVNPFTPRSDTSVMSDACTPGSPLSERRDDGAAPSDAPGDQLQAAVAGAHRRDDPISQRGQAVAADGAGGGSRCRPRRCTVAPLAEMPHTISLHIAGTRSRRPSPRDPDGSSAERMSVASPARLPLSPSRVKTPARRDAPHDQLQVATAIAHRR